MTILEKIVKYKRKEVEALKASVPAAILEKGIHFERPVRSLIEALNDKGSTGIIAEFKRRSPSQGVINDTARSATVCTGYFGAGAAAVSVLTDNRFFGGSNNDLLAVRDLCEGPLLRKEFIIEEYQVLESKSTGADAILLIADILSRGEMENLSYLAGLLRLEVLFEIHDESGIAKLPEGASLVGVNSRNLGDFSLNTDLPDEMAVKLPEGCIMVGESGIESTRSVSGLKSAGYRGFLIGTLFMKESDPAAACKRFISELKNEKQ